MGNNENRAAIEHRHLARIEQMVRELQSDLCRLVESGDLTDLEANEWAAHKQDQWMLQEVPQ